MRRFKNPRVLALAILTLLTVATAAQACWRCRQVCIVYVQAPDQTAIVPDDPKSRVIRALVIVDDNDPKDHDYNSQLNGDGGRVLGMLHNLPPEDCPNPILLSTKSTTRDNILERVGRKMEVGPDDTLLVYYIGHGKQFDQYKDSDDQKGHYLDLFLPGRNPAQAGMWRTELLDAMKSRNARMTVLITDACFAASGQGEPSMEIKSIGSRFKGVQRIPEQNRNVSVVQHLFLEHQGVVNINSCKPEEKALGDVFSPVLIKNLTEWKGDPTPTWETFFTAIQEGTSERAKDLIDNGQAPAFMGPEKGKQGTQTPYSFATFTQVQPRPVGMEPKPESMPAPQ